MGIWIRIVFILTCSASTVWAADLEGTWTGQETWQKSNLLTSTIAQTNFEVHLSKSELQLKECLSYINEEGRQTSQCLESRYEVVGEDIYLRGQKIGDIFPSRIAIFESNSQVSEQITIQTSGPNTIQFRYSYSNFDGDSQYRFGELRKKDPTQ